MTQPTGIEQRDLIEGLGKGLRVIECFDADHVRMTTSEVAERAALTRTAARRYLLSLVHYGYAQTDGRLFWLQPRVLRLGQSYLSAARLPRLVQPFIQRISMQTGETVNFSVLDGHEIVYLARSNPPRHVSIGYHVGARVPAHAVTPGYVLLALYDDAALDRWIAEHEFSSFTAHTPVDPAKFREQVCSARGLGYWMSDRLLDPGLRGVAVALRDAKGGAAGTIGMTVQHAAYKDDDVLQTLLPALRQVATEMRSLL